MTWFTENPMQPVTVGIILAALLVFVVMKTGRREALWALILTAAATIGLVIANVLIVTPREEVTATLEEIRLLVEANDRAALIDRIDGSAVKLRNQAQNDLTQLTVTAARINDLKVLIAESGQSAKAEFVGIIDFKDGGGRLPYTHIVLQFTVDLRKVDGRWLVTRADYQPYRPGGGGAGIPTVSPQLAGHVG